MKPATAIRFVAILVGVGAVIALIAFAISLGQSGSGPGGGNGTTPFGALFPFLGRAEAPSGAVQFKDETTTQTGPVPRLRLVTSEPVSGARFTKEGLIRYVERGTGHVFDVHADSFESTRISNLTLPGIEHVVWVGDSRFVAQFVRDGETVQNMLADIATSTSESTLTTVRLTGFKRAAASADGGTLLTVTEVGDGSRIESQTPGKAGSTRLVLSSPMRSWVPLVGGRDLMLLSAPATGVPGFLYLLESGGIGAKVVGNIPGLMALPSPDGRYVAYSGAIATGMALAVLDRKTETLETIPISTIVEKCAWFPTGEPRLFCGIPKSPTAVALDSWLLGLGDFSDNAWVISPVNGISTLVIDLANESGRPLDLVNPSVSEDGNYAIFQDKTDLSLWSLELSPR